METCVLDNIPLEEQRVIDELVKLWNTHCEPRDLAMHIDKLPSTWGRHIVRNFFRQVYEDLRTNKRSNYTAFSVSEFKRLLETEYSQRAPLGERQVWAKADAEAQAKAKEREEYVRKARADFDALGEEMTKTTDRKELIEIVRKREDLAPYIGIRHPYENVCWKCHRRISSTIHARCKDCGWYICSSCASCGCGYYEFYGYHDEAVNPFLPDYPDDLS